MIVDDGDKRSGRRYDTEVHGYGVSFRIELGKGIYSVEKEDEGGL